jgi:hypothetical protein
MLAKCKHRSMTSKFSRDKFRIHWYTAGVDRRAPKDKTFWGVGIISCLGCRFGFAGPVSIVLRMALKVLFNLFKILKIKSNRLKGDSQGWGIQKGCLY